MRIVVDVVDNDDDVHTLQSEGTVKVMRDKSTEVAELKEQVKQKTSC